MGVGLGMEVKLCPYQRRKSNSDRVARRQSVHRKIKWLIFVTEIRCASLFKD